MKFVIDVDDSYCNENTQKQLLELIFKNLSIKSKNAVQVNTFDDFLTKEILATSDAIEFLGITRQGLNYHAQKGNIIPILHTNTEKFYLKHDLQKLKK